MVLPRYDYFQTEESVIISILLKNVKIEDCSVFCNKQYITVTYNELIIFQGKLNDEFFEDRVELDCSPFKVEVRVPKKNPGRWDTLLEPESECGCSSSSKNWNAVEKLADEEEEKEELEGDAAVNRMFKKIYEDATDDVKKAMVKSFSESNGTVLSTNWDEIKQQRTDVKPPSSMEYKKFDQ